MSYTLQAIFGHEDEMRDAAPEDLSTVTLVDKFALWLIDSDYQDSHSVPFLPLTDGGQTVVPVPIVDLAGRLTECAYIEAEYFGGEGGQAAAFYRVGVQQGEINFSGSAINEVLRSLGVVAKAPYDEFDSIGLGRERNTNTWQ